MARLLRTKARVLLLLRCEGSMPRFFAASSTAFRISGATLVLPFRTREAVAMLTFAAWAISLRPILALSEGSFFITSSPASRASCTTETNREPAPPIVRSGQGGEVLKGFRINYVHEPI